MLSACSPHPQASCPAKTCAPFSADFARFEMVVPRRPDLYLAEHLGPTEPVHITVCPHNQSRRINGGWYFVAPTGCEGFGGPFDNGGGVNTFVWQPKPTTQFSLLREKPLRARTPRAVPLLELGHQDDVHPFAVSEWYELSRLDGLGDKGFQTTDQGWPLAVCRMYPGQKGAVCDIGFLLDGAYVEAHAFTSFGSTVDLPNQAQVWELATELDQKLRALISDRRRNLH